jgi:hypothetical protein
LSGLKIVDGKVDGMVSYKVGIPDTVEKVGGRNPINAKWAYLTVCIL